MAAVVVSRLRAGITELVLVAALYLAYTGSRMLADDNVFAALGRARKLLHVEDGLGLAWEHTTNLWLAAHDRLGVIASFWYSSGHYVVTAAVLVWLFRRGRDVYVPARRALAVSTLLGLVFYLLMPTAPPRMIAGYVDVLDLHADVGWWGADASAPKGLGGLTNELAAFPSLHAGWSLWVALAVSRATRGSGARGHIARTLAWSYAAITAVVVVGTANHWTLDVLVGWVVALAGWALATTLPVVTRVTREPVPDTSASLAPDASRGAVRNDQDGPRVSDRPEGPGRPRVPLVQGVAAVSSGRPGSSPRAARP